MNSAASQPQVGPPSEAVATTSPAAAAPSAACSAASAASPAAAPTPLISVVVAVRNAEHALSITLETLRRQTCRDFEVVLVDGASTDGTLGVARGYGDLISTLVSEPDDGIADAWNKGVQRARGQWIIFLNAGDLLHAQHFERAIPALRAAGAKRLLYCDVLKFSKDGQPTTLITGRTPTLASIRRGGIGFGHPGSFAPRQAFQEEGLFNTRLKIAIDTDFLLRCFKAGYAFERFDSIAYMAEGGVSDRRFDRAMNEYFLCARRLGLVDERQARLGRVLLPAARKLLHAARGSLYGPLRLLKHALVAQANLLGALLPLAGLRRLYFGGVLGFRLGRGATLGMGLRFYVRGNVTLGERSVINRDCLLDNRAPILIGKDVSIARDVRIFTAGHDPDSPLFEMTRAPVHIGDHAVVFAGCSIMPGVTIGRGAVVYAGSVVTRDVPPMAIVAGAPAKVLRQRMAEPIYRLHYPYPLAM